MGSAPASLADNPFLITLLLEMQTTIFLRTEMSRKTEYVHNPCFLSANILKILGVFAENQDIFATKNMSKMIIETIERLSIDVFVTAMAITAVVIATIALSLLASPFCQ